MNQNILKRLKNYDPYAFSLLKPKERAAALALGSVSDAFTMAAREAQETLANINSGDGDAVAAAAFDRYSKANETLNAINNALKAEAAAYVKRYGAYPDETIKRMADYATAFVKDTIDHVKREGGALDTDKRLTTGWISFHVATAWAPIAAAMEFDKGRFDFIKRATDTLDRVIKRALGNKEPKTPQKKGLFNSPETLRATFIGPDILRMAQLYGPPDQTRRTPDGPAGLYKQGKTAVMVLPQTDFVRECNAESTRVTSKLIKWGTKEVATLLYCLGELPFAHNNHRMEREETVNYALDISIEAFQNAAGIKEKRHARDRLLNDALYLSFLRIHVTEPTYIKGAKKATSAPSGFMSIVIGAYQVDRDYVRIELHPRFAAYMANSFLQYVPRDPLMKIDLNKHPNALFLGYSLWNLIWQKKEIDRDGNVYIVVSVPTAARYCPTIPSEPKMTERQKREMKRTVWAPLQNALDALDEVLTWEFCKTNGEPLTEEDLNAPDTWRVIRERNLKIYPRAPYIETNIPARLPESK